VDRFSADLVVGVEEGLGQEVADVPAAQPVEHPSTLSVALDEAGQAQLGQVLAGGGGPAAGDMPQARPAATLVLPGTLAKKIGM